MVNTYFKMLNNSIQEKYTNGIISDVQTSLRNSCTHLNPNIYDTIQKLENNTGPENIFDINTLLKCYILNQMIKDTSNDINTTSTLEKVLKDTPNPNIKYNKEENAYYKLTNNKYTRDDTIQEIEENGYYTVVVQQDSYSYKIKKKYNTENSIHSLQLLEPNGTIVSDKWQASEIIGMRKEFAHRHRYTGYSGSSCDLIASLLNKLTTPIETGLYMDKQYKLFKWSEKDKCFIRETKKEAKSPLLTDYEFINKIVIRKEYTGVK